MDVPAIKVVIPSAARQCRRVVELFVIAAALAQICSANEFELVEPLPASAASPAIAADLPVAAPPAEVPAASAPSYDSVRSLAVANQAYEAAVRRQVAGDPLCVDLYFHAAICSWRSLSSEIAARGPGPPFPYAAIKYRESLRQLLLTAQQFRRIDKAQRLSVQTDQGPLTVPIEYFGFAWQPSDFTFLLPASDFQGDATLRHYFNPGLGISLVGVRVSTEHDRHYRPKHPIAVSALLRERAPQPCPPGGGDPSGSATVVLEMYNPHVIDQMTVSGAPVHIERDLTAALVFAFRESPRMFLEGYLYPADAGVRPKLIMLEPYQAGKIPIIFVHGLLSDALDWSDLANELRAQPDLYKQYQFWAFRYPTGSEFLASAATFRELRRQAREMFDPQCADPAWDRTVIIAHSLGGLMAKLQVVESYDILWRKVAHAPFENLRAPPAETERLRRSMFLTPDPAISSIIFLGTPHRGSAMSRRVIGRISADLVKIGEEEDQQYRRLMDANHDVFYPYLWDRQPTSIDLLEPDSPLLAALQEMPLSPCVQMHSVIGTGDKCSREPGDGVVPVSSARQAGVVSELFVDAKHSELRSNPAVVAQVMRILRAHLAGDQAAHAAAIGLR